MQWNASYVESVFSFANNINTHRGRHASLRASRAALTRTMNKYARDEGLLKEKEDNLEGEDMREGLAAVISVKLRDPQFEGQTKTKLGNPWVARLRREDRQRRSSASSSRRTRPTRKRIVRKAIDAVARAPGGAQGARASSRKGALSAACLPGKLADCVDQRPRARRALHRRGRLGRRLRRARRATAASRRSCRCAARSSTARRTASTRCSRTPRSRR